MKPHTLNNLIWDIVNAEPEWFGTLHYPAPPKHCADTRAWQARGDKLAGNWAGRIFLSVGAGADYRQVIIIERRKDQSSRYHILMGGLRSWAGFNDDRYVRRWRERFSAPAYERQFNLSRLGGLIRFLVTVVGCELYVFMRAAHCFYRGGSFVHVPEAQCCYDDGALW
jgi:hypothetical protein